MWKPAPAIGIDLGMTDSRVAIMRNGKMKIFANEMGSFETASVVGFSAVFREDMKHVRMPPREKETQALACCVESKKQTKKTALDGFQRWETLVGDEAKHEMIMNPENIVFEAKRLIGRKYSDPTVTENVKRWPFKITAFSAEPHIEVGCEGRKEVRLPEQISAIVLGELKKTAERYLNQRVKDAVVTVPASFNNDQRRATIDAGRIAGFSNVRLINEPTAAAIAFIHKNHRKIGDNANLLVFDLGGGTCNVSILTVDRDQITVKATNEDAHLGGDDFDSRLVEFCVQDFQMKHRRDVSNNDRAKRRLRSACERAKRVLSVSPQARIVVEALVDGIDYSAIISRPRFEYLNSTLFKKTLDGVQLALDDAQLTKSDIHKIILVGGSARIPRVQQLLKEFFGGKKLEFTVNPHEVVAYGAAIHADVICGNTDQPDIVFVRLLQDVPPYSLRIDSTAEECDVKKPFTSLKKTISFTTSSDHQPIISFRLLQGDGSNPLQDSLVGQFEVSGFRSGPKGEPKIAVTFETNSSGILVVTARDDRNDGQGDRHRDADTSLITIENVSRRWKKQRIEQILLDLVWSRERQEDNTAERSIALKVEFEKFRQTIVDILNEIQ